MKTNDRVKRALSAHKVLGLSAASCLYWICLSGCIIVFAAQLARWEQPDVAESLQVSPQKIENALHAFIADKTALESLTIMLPTPDMPRTVLYHDDTGYVLQQDGSLGAVVKHEWLEFIEHLHTSLHLPHELGTIVVGIFGVMLGALIITGLYAHPRIFRDAFRLRLGGNRRLHLADLHNRLGVWGLPFHLMMAVTGALFGMISILVIFAAPKYFDGDQNAIVDSVYGPDPHIEAPVQDLQAVAALTNFSQIFPEASPIFLMAQNIDTPQQFIEIGATLPGRLIYAEMYRFNADGSFQGYQQLSDGPWGRQVIYSIYRLHFGQYGGLWLRFAYVVLGLALTILSASGVSIYLARRGGENAANALWCAVVWGSPLAIAVLLPVTLLTPLNTIVVFVVVLMATMVFALWQKNAARSRALMQAATAFCLLLGLLLYVGLKAANPWQPVIASISVAIFLAAFVMLYLSFDGFKKLVPANDS